ncbi:MAG: hypothetical protein ACHQZQ_00155 [SAR324 cluster bacterium]
MAGATDKTDEELLEWLDGKFMKWVVSAGAGQGSEPLAPLGKALKWAQQSVGAAGQERPRIARDDEPIVIEFEQIARLWKHPKFLKHPSFKVW